MLKHLINLATQANQDMYQRALGALLNLFHLVLLKNLVQICILNIEGIYLKIIKNIPIHISIYVTNLTKFGMISGANHILTSGGKSN